MLNPSILEVTMLDAIMGLFPLFRGRRISADGGSFHWKRELISPMTFVWVLFAGLFIGCILDRIPPLRNLWRVLGASHSTLLFWTTMLASWILAAVLRVTVIWLGSSLYRNKLRQKNQSEQVGPGQPPTRPEFE